MSSLRSGDGWMAIEDPGIDLDALAAVEIERTVECTNCGHPVWFIAGENDPRPCTDCGTINSRSQPDIFDPAPAAPDAKPCDECGGAGKLVFLTHEERCERCNPAAPELAGLRDTLAMKLFDLVQRFHGGTNWCFTPELWYREADAILAILPAPRVDGDAVMAAIDRYGASCFFGGYHQGNEGSSEDDVRAAKQESDAILAELLALLGDGRQGVQG